MKINQSVLHRAGTSENFLSYSPKNKCFAKIFGLIVMRIVVVSMVILHVLPKRLCESFKLILLFDDFLCK